LFDVTQEGNNQYTPQPLFTIALPTGRTKSNDLVEECKSNQLVAVQSKRWGRQEWGKAVCFRVFLNPNEF